MKIYTLGTSHGAAEKGRSCSGTLIEVGGAYYLFDCGGNMESKLTDMGMPIEKIRCVFISHMHEDHVGSLSGIVKRFNTYIYTGEVVEVYMPEQEGIDAFFGWLKALHFGKADKYKIMLTKDGEVYSDENITVTAIRTNHIMKGAFPSYAYMIESAEGRVLYTGDLNHEFDDYPSVVFEKDFDAIVCELVHFNVEKNLDTIIKSRAKKLIFTHMSLDNIPKIESAMDRFPFSVEIAQDGMEFDV